MNPRHTARLLSTLVGLFLLSVQAWAWFAEDHEIMAIIAADDLTPTARSHVAQMLSVPGPLIRSKRGRDQLLRARR
jgi:hypothetical protein